MDAALVYLFVGLLAAVPLAIAANLLTPTVQRRLAARSNMRAATALARSQAQRDEAAYFLAHPDELTHRLLRSIIGIVGLGLSATLTLGVVVLAIWLLPPDAPTSDLRAIVLGAVTTFEVALVSVALYAILSSAGDVLGLTERVRNLRGEIDANHRGENGPSRR